MELKHSSLPLLRGKYNSMEKKPETYILLGLSTFIRKNLDNTLGWVIEINIGL